MIEHPFVGLRGFSVTSEVTMTTGLAAKTLIVGFIFDIICVYLKIFEDFFFVSFNDERTFFFFDL